MVERLISGSFKCAVQLSDRRQFEVTGYFFSDDTLVEMHHRVDMAQDVLDRQAIRADVSNKQAQIEALLAGQRMGREGFEDLVAMQQSGKQLTGQQQQAMDNFEISLQRSKQSIEELQAAVATGRERLNGHALNA